MGRQRRNGSSDSSSVMSSAGCCSACHNCLVLLPNAANRPLRRAPSRPDPGQYDDHSPRTQPLRPAGNSHPGQMHPATSGLAGESQATWWKVNHHFPPSRFAAAFRSSGVLQSHLTLSERPVAPPLLVPRCRLFGFGRCRTKGNPVNHQRDEFPPVPFSVRPCFVVRTAGIVQFEPLCTESVRCRLDRAVTFCGGHVQPVHGLLRKRKYLHDTVPRESLGFRAATGFSLPNTPWPGWSCRSWSMPRLARPCARGLGWVESNR